MLTQLTLQNLALVEQAELDMHPGFNVITGETGAGKSLLLDALQLCVGGRTDGGLIRHGHTTAEAFAEFVKGEKAKYQEIVKISGASLN